MKMKTKTVLKVLAVMAAFTGLLDCTGTTLPIPVAQAQSAPASVG
jgi:hypothetical protein